MTASNPKATQKIKILHEIAEVIKTFIGFLKGIPSILGDHIIDPIILEGNSNNPT